ncbi:UDP-glucosyltransferase 2-like [Zerene cesonia]|uniref:UDP-glucosyltransferase 2-like n=1 Tax=Zerene cesonia TaxID=33412 RepID=UPI0018E58B2F|nr:UDP-glucosyltransferase 2-like [Zerene cesonia]
MLRPLIVLASLLAFSNAYKILVVFPFPARSHSILGNGVVDALLKGNHEITHVTAFPRKKNSPNLREIDVSKNLVLIPDTMRMVVDALLRNTNFDIDISEFVVITTKMISQTIENPAVQELFNNPNEKFDAIVIEWFFNDALSGLSAIFKCPYIWVSSVDPHWRVLALVDEMPSPTYTPDMTSTSVPPFNFMQRAQELMMQVMGLGLNYFVINNLQLNAYQNLLVPFIEKRGYKAPSLNEVLYNSSLLLSNSHPSMGTALSLPQNVKAVGGYHIGRDVKPLPDDLKKTLDNSKDGLIFFSLGSNVKSAYLPDKVKRELLKVFGGLKQTVLWKFEEELPDTPPNVHIMKWAPQTSILAHPNCIIFITHGGLLSTTEAVHFGKAIIAIPIYADQPTNSKRAVSHGFALQVELTMNLANDLKVALEEMISNPM